MASTRAVTDPKDEVLCVIVVIAEGWECFDQFAMGLRREGLKVVRVTCGQPRSTAQAWSRHVWAWAYGDSVTIRGDADLPALFRDLGPESVEDILCDEYRLRSVLAAAEMAGVPQDVLGRLARFARWADKVVCADDLAAAGIPIPLTVTGVMPAEAASRVGYPLLAKARIGTAGHRVRLVRDADELLASTASLEASGEPLLYQRFVDGIPLDYVCLVRDGTPTHEGVYEATISPDDPLGPPVSGRVIDHPAVTELGRSVASLLGGSGLLNVDVLQAADGGLWVIDVNARAWGSVLALRSADADFVTAYLDLLLNRAPVGDLKPLRVGAPFSYFPSGVEARWRAGDRWAAVMAWARSGFRFVRWVGPRYTLAATLVLALPGLEWRSRRLRRFFTSFRRRP